MAFFIIIYLFKLPLLNDCSLLSMQIHPEGSDVLTDSEAPVVLPISVHMKTQKKRWTLKSLKNGKVNRCGDRIKTWIYEASTKYRVMDI